MEDREVMQNMHVRAQFVIETVVKKWQGTEAGIYKIYRLLENVLELV